MSRLILHFGVILVVILASTFTLGWIVDVETGSMSPKGYVESYAGNFFDFVAVRVALGTNVVSKEASLIARQGLQARLAAYAKSFSDAQKRLEMEESRGAAYMNAEPAVLWTRQAERSAGARTDASND